jgi:molecular chaperone DnaJ
MNLKEAYSILEIPSTATEAEAKKKYRELTKKYHPDVNKDAGAEDKFKKINEAYQIVSSGKGTDREPNPFSNSSGNPFSGIQNPFGRQHYVRIENINLHTTISFKESVLGCKKDLKFNRKAKCQDCQGQGEYTINNGCDKCNGRGQTVTRQGNMVMMRTCDKCYGRSSTEPCKPCNATGMLEAEASISVTIPGGIQNGNVLRLSGMGHFIGSFGPLEQHTDVHLHVSVTPEKGLTLDGADVVSTIEISLLEALQGCHKSVNTIMGTKEVDIKSMSRNKEEIIIPRLGVNGSGNQRVILDVKYPEDVSKLVGILSNERIS